jgi:hypothetical protein
VNEERTGKCLRQVEHIRGFIFIKLALLQLQDTDNTSTVSVKQDVETGTCSQTDVGMDLIGSMESEMQRLLEENNKSKFHTSILLTITKR